MEDIINDQTLINNEEYFKDNKIVKFNINQLNDITIYNPEEFVIKIKSLFTDEEIYNIKKYLKQKKNNEYIYNINFLRNYYKRFKYPLKIKINNQILKYDNKKSLIFYKKIDKYKLGSEEYFEPLKKGLLVIINFGKSSETNFYFEEKNYFLKTGEPLLMYVEKKYKIKFDISDYDKYIMMFIVKYE